jgi:hypothetical protein
MCLTSNGDKVMQTSPEAQAYVYLCVSMFQASDLACSVHVSTNQPAHGFRPNSLSLATT